MQEDTHWNTHNGIYGDSPIYIGGGPVPNTNAMAQSLNLYTYVNNQPTIYQDLNGQFIVPLLIGIGAAASIAIDIAKNSGNPSKSGPSNTSNPSSGTNASNNAQKPIFQGVSNMFAGVLPLFSSPHSLLSNLFGNGSGSSGAKKTNSFLNPILFPLVASLTPQQYINPRDLGNVPGQFDRNSTVSLMALVLVGQNELWDKLRMQLYAAIRGRIDIKCELAAMDRADLGEYVKAHLAYGGGKDEIFTDAALDELHRYSAGSARAVNKAATHCLMYAFQRSKRLIDDVMVKTVIEAELP